MQDVAIAHGYNNIHASVPQCATVGAELPINELSELLRGEVRFPRHPIRCFKCDVWLHALCSSPQWSNNYQSSLAVVG